MEALVQPKELPPVRARVRVFVLENPGCTISTIASFLAVTHTTATNHARGLVRDGCIVQVRDGREVRHFTSTHDARGTAYVTALAQDPKRRSIIDAVQAAPVERMSINQIAEHCALPFGVVKRTLDQLARAGLVDVTRRDYRYQVRRRELARPVLAFA